MRTFATKLLLVLLPVALTVVVNVAYDPSHALRDGPEREAASLLVAGKTVAGLVNYDERRLVWYFLQQLSAPRNVGVIGSSRAMQIRAADFPGSTLFNASVSATTIEDLVAIAGEHARRGLLPARMVVELDPWLLNGRRQNDQWRVMEQAYNEVMAASGLPPAPRTLPQAFTRVQAALSPAYFQEALREIKAHRSLRLSPAVEATTDVAGLVLPDGSHVYPLTMRARTPAFVEGLAAGRVADLRRNAELTDFTELDPFALQRLEAMIAFMRARGSMVSLLLSPFHPTTVRLLQASGEYDMIARTEAAYRELAARVGVPLGGSFDAVVAGCGPDEFFDSDHPRESCVSRILRTMALVE